MRRSIFQNPIPQTPFDTTSSRLLWRIGNHCKPLDDHIFDHLHEIPLETAISKGIFFPPYFLFYAAQFLNMVGDDSCIAFSRFFSALMSALTFAIIAANFSSHSSRVLASKFVFRVMNGATNVGSGYFSQLDACSRLSINYSELMPSGYSYISSSYAARVSAAIKKTNGLNLTYNSRTSATTIYNHICNYTEPPRVEYDVIIPTGWSTIRLKGILDPESDIDTDYDDLTDWEEVDNEHISFDTYPDCI